MAEKGNFEGSGKGKKAKVDVPDILEEGGEPAAAGAADNGTEKTASENGVGVHLISSFNRRARSLQFLH